MATFKIENYDESGSTFTFPHNSKVFDDANTFDNINKEVPFDNKHIYITSGSLRPKILSIQGQFEGASKETNWRSLLEKCASKKLKKFYFDSDRFYIVLSPQFKKTHSGGRTNFLDYVGSFVTPIPFVFSDTQKNDIYTSGAPGSWTDGSKTNAGSHKTFIEKVVVVMDAGGSAGHTFTIKDGHTNGITVTMDAYSENDEMIIYLIKMVDSKGINTTEYWYVTNEDTQIQRGTAASTNGMDLILDPAERIDTMVISGNANYKTATFYWRDTDLS